jgi:disulfide bond formation protein DsbB
MADGMTMRATWIERLRAEPAADAAIAIFLISLATLAGAWYFEFVLKLPPCPLCLVQRLPYHVIVPLSLLLAIAALVRAPEKLIGVGFVAIIFAALSGAVLGAYHAGVEWHFWAGSTSCSGDAGDLSAKSPLLDQLQSIHVVSCTEAAWRFLGNSLAGYNVLISLAMAAIAVFGLLAREQELLRYDPDAPTRAGALKASVSRRDP